MRDSPRARWNPNPDQTRHLWRGSRDGQQECTCYSSIQTCRCRPHAWPYTCSGKHDQHSPSIIPCKLTGHPRCTRLWASLNWYAGSEYPTLFLGFFREMWRVEICAIGIVMALGSGTLDVGIAHPRCLLRDVRSAA